MISVFRHDVDVICAVLGYYVALNGSSVATFRDNVSGPVLNGQEVQEVGKVVPKRRYRITTQRCVISQKSGDLHSRGFDLVTKYVT